MKSFPVFRALKWHVPKLCCAISVDRVGVSAVTSGQRGFTRSISYAGSQRPLGIMVLNEIVVLLVGGLEVNPNFAPQ